MAMNVSIALKHKFMFNKYNKCYSMHGIRGGVGDYLLTLAYQVLGAKEFNKLLPMPKL